jgi:hypothetical protein
MRRHLVLALAALALFAAGQANAQTYIGPRTGPMYGPGYRGNISPYLNLFRGNNTGIDYYLGTRSEFQRRADARQFGADIADLERREAQGAYDEEGPRRDLPIQSGTPAGFGSTMGYYNNRQNYLAPTVVRSGGNPVGSYAPPVGRRR